MRSRSPASRASRRRTWRPTTSAGRCRRRSRECCGRSIRCAARRPRGRNPIALRWATCSSTSASRSISPSFPTLQALAQRVAACYTGRQDVCRALGIMRKEDADLPIGHRLLEGAMVRMAAVAVIDVASGRIEALAGALSPCTRQEYDGPGRAARVRHAPAVSDPLSPRRAAQSRGVSRRDAGVGDQADHGRRIPVRSGGRHALAGGRARAMQRTPWPARDSLRGQLMRSDSARFLDRMFCADRKFAQCMRAWEVQAAAAAFGWNAECARARRATAASATCCSAAQRPRTEWSRSRALAAMPVPFGRLMVEPMGDAPGAPFQLRRKAAFDTGKVATCAAGPDGRRRTRDDWEKCRGAHGRRRRRRRLGPGQCARQRARRRGHDGHARRGGQRRDRTRAASRAGDTQRDDDVDHA